MTRTMTWNKYEPTAARSVLVTLAGSVSAAACRRCESAGPATSCRSQRPLPEAVRRPEPCSAVVGRTTGNPGCSRTTGASSMR